MKNLINSNQNQIKFVFKRLEIFLLVISLTFPSFLNAQKRMLYLKCGEPVNWSSPNTPGSQYIEMKKWQANGFSLQQMNLSTTNITSSMLSNFDVVRINAYGGSRSFDSMEGDAIYNWVKSGGKLLADINFRNQVPLVKLFGVLDISGSNGGYYGTSWKFHGAPLILSSVSGPSGYVGNIGVECMDEPILATNHNFTIDASISGAPAIVHKQLGEGKIILIFANGWSMDVVHPGNAYRASIKDQNNTNFLENCISYLSAANPILKILVPEGGEVASKGQSVTILWESSSLTGNAEIRMDYPGSSNIMGTVDVKKNEYSFTIPSYWPSRNDYRAVVTVYKGNNGKDIWAVSNPVTIE